MSGLQKIKQAMTELLQFNVIANALKQIATAQMCIKRKQVGFTKSIMNSLRLAVPVNDIAKVKKELHVFISCDQRFCRRFLKPLNEYFARIIDVTCDGVGEFEYVQYEQNNAIDPTDIDLFKLSMARKFEEMDFNVYQYQNIGNKVDFAIFGLQSHKIFDELDEANPIKKRAIKAFTEAQELSANVQQYDAVFIHSYDDESATDDTAYQSYISGFKGSPIPVTYLAQEIYHFATISALKEHSVRTQVMSEAADNSKNEAKKARMAFNRKRQSAITASTALMTVSK